MDYDYLDAKTIYENGFVKGDFDEIFAFAKISIHEERNSERVTEKLILSELKSSGMNTVSLYEVVHKAVLWAKKPLSKESSVFIYEQELENIRVVADNFSRVLFAALFLAKKDGNPDYYNRDIQEAISLSKVRGFSKNSDERLLFYKFTKDWIPCILNTASRRILYSDNNSPLAFEIDKKENPMKYFPKYCRECGKRLGFTAHNRSQYCENHISRN